MFNSVPSTANVSDPGNDARAAELVREAGEKLVFAESNGGRGSGFICKLDGKYVLMSNQHVIGGNPNVRFTTLSQTALKPGGARAAVGHDLIAYDSPGAFAAFEVETNVLQNVSVGDSIVVLGNMEGASVIKPLHGKVVAVGPNLVEISAEFMPGNSGSPIVHLDSGKVIGVATYAIIRKVDSLTQSGPGSVRRFGYRIDSVKNWQPIDWSIYQTEAAAISRVSEFSASIIRLLGDIRRGRVNGANHSDSRLKPAINELEPLYRSGLNANDRKRSVQGFLRMLRNAVQRDVEELRARLRYDYFQREIAEESKFREEIYKGLGEAIGSIERQAATR